MEMDVSKIILLQSLVRRFLAKGVVKKQYQKQEHRMKLIKELISSEETYVHQLNTSVEEFMLPLLQSKVAPPEKIKRIFSNTNEILPLHKIFLESLYNWRNTLPSSASLGKLFLIHFQETAQQKSINYISNYEKSSDTLDQLEKSSAFVDFMEKLFQNTTDTKKQFLHLPSYLILPIQRIPRYSLILKEIIKQTDSNHVDYNNLEQALHHIQEMSETIDKKSEPQHLKPVTQRRPSSAGNDNVPNYMKMTVSASKKGASTSVPSLVNNNNQDPPKIKRIGSPERKFPVKKYR